MVTIFETYVADHYCVILNASSQVCKNETFISKISTWYKIESKFFLHDLKEALCKNLFDVETEINQTDSDELFNGWRKSSELTLNHFYQKNHQLENSKISVDSEVKQAASKKSATGVLRKKT